MWKGGRVLTCAFLTEYSFLGNAALRRVLTASMEFIADKNVQAREAWTSFVVTCQVQPGEPYGTKIHNFFTNIANSFTCLQVVSGHFIAEQYHL